MYQHKEQVLTQLRILGMRYTWEILASINSGSKFLKQIARETRIPYTTVQKRVNDLEKAGLVRVFNDVDGRTGKFIRKVRVSRFRLSLDPYTIERMVKEGRVFINRA